MSPGAETGRQAWLRAMCSLERAGSTPALGTLFKIEFREKNHSSTSQFISKTFFNKNQYKNVAGIEVYFQRE